MPLKQGSNAPVMQIVLSVTRQTCTWNCPVQVTPMWALVSVPLFSQSSVWCEAMDTDSEKTLILATASAWKQLHHIWDSPATQVRDTSGEACSCTTIGDKIVTCTVLLVWVNYFLGGRFGYF